MARYRKKDTGEIVDVASYSMCGGYTKYIDSKGVLHKENISFYNAFEDINEINWEQRRYEIAKEAMNGLLAAPVAKNLTINLLFNEIVARTAEKAVKIADCLIEELKKGVNND